jgi:PAS domain S-box-containing protein
MAETVGLQKSDNARQVVDVDVRPRSMMADEESNRILRLIADRSPVLIAYIGADLRYKFVNKPYAERFGLQPEEVVGKTMRELIGEEAFASVESYVNVALGGEHVEFEVEVPFLEIRSSSIWASYDPEFDEEGRVIGFVLTGIDITERKQAEEWISVEKQFSDMVVDSLPGIFYIITDQGQFLRWNKNMVEVSGYSGEEISKMSPLDFFCEADKELIAERIEQVFTKGEATAEADFVTKRGDPIPYFFTGSLIEFNRVPCLVGMGIDVARRRQAEVAQAYLAAIVESSEDAVIAVSLDNHITSWNAGAERLYGYTAAEVVGRPLDILIPPGHVDVEEETKILSRIKQGERVKQQEIQRRAKDGRLISVSLTVSPIKDKGGRIIGASKVARDITEKKRAENIVRESEERLQLALDAGQVSTWDWDLARDKVTWSDSTYQLFGRKDGDFGGKLEDFFALVHPDDRERVKAAVNAAIENHEPYSIEMRVIWPDGSVRWIATNGRVLFDSRGRALRMLGATVDITERKEAEEEFKESDRRKDEFLAMLAHELRNPLAPIRNAVQALKRLGPPEPQRGRLQDMIDRQVAHMARMIDDLLDVSRITRNKIALRKERIRLTDVVNRAVETSRPLIDARKHKLTVTLSPELSFIEGDLVRLAQIISNLLNNAAKYTEEGGNIWLTAESSGGEAVIRVRDDGIGIPDYVLPQVFDLFAQADRSLDRSQGGLGIGLTLVRSLAELHGGRVEAHSEGTGKGSEFVVRLPSASRSETEGEIAPPTNPGSQDPSPRARILVVDDNKDAAESMATLLEIVGHDVRVTYDGVKAVEAARNFRPHAVLLDIGLPGMSGYEVARQLRGLDETKKAFLIAVTGYGKPEDRVKALTNGFNYHITKPVDPDEIYIIINNLKRD